MKWLFKSRMFNIPGQKKYIIGSDEAYEMPLLRSHKY